MTTRRHSVLCCALALLAGGRVLAAEPLGAIVAPVDRTTPAALAGELRAIAPTAKAAPVLVTENALLGRLEKELTRQLNVDGELRLTFGRAWQPIRVPGEDWQVSLSALPVGGLTKSFFVRVRIDAGERACFDQQMVLQAQLWKPAFVTTRRVERGQPLDRSAVEVQTLDVLRERFPPIPATTKLEDQELLQTVIEGHPLTWKDVTATPLVRKGAIVEVVAGDGAMAITMKGLAMGTGGLGDAITIRNVDTRKDFPARVVNRNSVRVAF